MPQMPHTTTGCDCDSCALCGTLPAEFVRVRYFFGQRLGVMELNDQAIYHAGKMAFHNARLHGYGVVCGLKVQKQKGASGTTKSTVLRVSTGAALDLCGRELVVGIDQCIDVAAWFAKNRTRPELAGWTAGKPQTLRVAIRYRECTSDPSPAPRDPCGCDNGGCEYGRVRESFELALFTEDEKICAPEPFTPGTDLLAVTERCSTPSDEAWLCLAAFDVTLDATTLVPVDITEPDNAIPERRTLLSTSALQALLLSLTGGNGTPGVLPAGPRPGAVAFTAKANTNDAGTLVVPIVLAKTGNPAAEVALVNGTFDGGNVTVSRLDVSTGWDPPTSSVASYEDSPPRIQVKVPSALTPHTVFLLAFTPDPSQPTVDANGSPLAPFTRRFQFVSTTNGELALDPSV
jgi:hypothetical protein